jgi:hypothetical protein
MLLVSIQCCLGAPVLSLNIASKVGHPAKPRSSSYLYIVLLLYKITKIRLRAGDKRLIDFHKNLKLSWCRNKSTAFWFADSFRLILQLLTKNLTWCCRQLLKAGKFQYSFCYFQHFEVFNSWMFTYWCIDSQKFFLYKVRTPPIWGPNNRSKYILIESWYLIQILIN